MNTYKIDIPEVISIIDSIGIAWDNQLSITSRCGNNLLDGVGSIRDYGGATEKDFNEINWPFKDTCIERILHDIVADGYAIGRVRFMRMKPKTTYTYHMDCEERLHFAITTNAGAMIIVDDEVVRIPSDGTGYMVNTTKYHTAVNAHNSERIHLVITLLYPVKREGDHYIVKNVKMNNDEFNDWLVETKPETEPARMDYYFV